ncbi:hypothetical protein PR202_ga19536 [Eleusine coracana subsp. coracana]|uniref:VOC domain-containing protein n=1 Tax=Eleusine coracana subsp. coracana TaxID=191504 RepID=A0AAV5CVD8_ELECO|nr:hypothetical protein PR202_ga19536 [Eleusine coracana subsp. coracana]
MIRHGRQALERSGSCVVLWIAGPGRQGRGRAQLKESMDFHEEPDTAVPLVRLNHVSFQCSSVEESVCFYQRVLGFELIKRPASLDFKGAW